MSKKKHPEHVNHERWLVSYADFITLLFAFFVVLFASGQSDKRKQVKLAQAMQVAFAHEGIFDAHAKTPPLTDASTPPANVRPAALVLPVPGIGPATHAGSGAAGAAGAAGATSAAANAREAIERVLKSEAQKHKLDPAFVTLHGSPDGLVVSLREAGFFASGSADLRPGALEVFEAVANALPHSPMRIEGHTDNLPIQTQQFATNWELSTARAATITRLLIDDGAVDPAQVSAAGYAEFRPAATNTTKAGRAQNRRVDIVLLDAHPGAPATGSTPSRQAP